MPFTDELLTLLLSNGDAMRLSDSLSVFLQRQFNVQGKVNRFNPNVNPVLELEGN